VSIIDWISYGHALRTEKGASQTFGKGDIRGVIAAESATNAREGGALVPMVAFGVPTSAGMAVLLGAFLIHGLVPGPDMLGKNLDVTYSMVWSIAIANILGSGLCFLFSGQFAKLATLRYTLIMPIVLSLVFIGAFEGGRQWGDLYALLGFGVVGWAMKHCQWPRPPLVLGFILGKVIERFLFISIQRYGIDWMLHPVVIVMFALALAGLLRSFLGDVRAHGGARKMLAGFGAPRFGPGNLLPAALACIVVAMLLASQDWGIEAAIIPMIVGTGATLFCVLTLANDVFREPAEAASAGAGDEIPPELAQRAAATGGQKIHMDIGSHIGHLPIGVIVSRGALFFGWMAAFLASMAAIGLIATVPVFIIAYMRLEGRERWSLTLSMATGTTLFVYALFDRLLAIPWPQTLLGAALPALKAIPGV